MTTIGPVLTTTRCALRPIGPADLDELHQLWTSQGVRRYLWDDKIVSVEEVQGAIARSERLFHEHQFGLWGMRSQEWPRLAGFCGIWPFREPLEFELVYGVAEELWGRDYAGEMSRAVIGYCFESLQMPSVCASTDAANTASARVLAKLHFDFVRRGFVGDLDTMFFALPVSRYDVLWMQHS